MRNKGKWKIVVIVAVLVTIGSCAAMTVYAGLADYPGIKEPHHHIEQIGHNSTQIHSTAILFNPNIFPIKFKKVEYSIFLNDILIGNGQSEDNVLILPRSEKKLAFVSDIYQKQILKWLKERIKTRKNTTVNIKGDVTFDLGIFDYKYPINISITESEIWKKHFNSSFSFAYPVTDLNGDKISEMIIDVWNFEDGYISGEVRVVDGKDGSLLWNRSLGAGIPVAYPATDLNGDNSTDFIVNVWDIDRDWATQILVLNGVNGSVLWEWEAENGLAAAYPCTDFNGDGITEIIVNSYRFVEEEKSTATSMSQASMTVPLTNSTLSATIDTTGAYTLRVTDNSPPNEGDTETVDVKVTEKLVIFDMPLTVVIGEDIELKGAANAGDFVDIAIGGYIVKTSIPIEADGTFEEDLPTPETSGTGAPGSIWIKAFIRVAGEPAPELYKDVSGVDEDGSVAILLTTGTLTAEISVISVAQEDSFVVVGTAEGSDFVDIITIAPKGGSGNGIAPESVPDVPGMSRDSSAVSDIDYTFLKELDVDEDADTGKYVVVVLSPGGNGEYDGINSGELFGSAFEAIYGRISALEAKTQEQIISILGDATIDAAESDDLMWVGYIKVETPFVRLNPSEDVGIGEPLFVTGTSNREGNTIIITVKGPMELTPRIVEVENGSFEATFDTTDAEVGTYIVKADDGDGLTDEATVEILAATPTPMPEETPLKLADMYADYGIDTDGDEKYDYLAVEVWVSVSEAGDYCLRGSLRDSVWRYVAASSDMRNLNKGLQAFTLKFNGYDIYRNGDRGSFTFDFGLYDEDWNMIDREDNAYTSPHYSYTDFDVPPIDLTDAYADYGIDTDGNGKYDYLAIDVGVNVKEAGTYEVYGGLYDNKGRFVTSDGNEVNLSRGLQKFTLKFDGHEIYGHKIYKNGVDGPFLLRYVELYDEWNSADYKYDAYVTSYYNYTEFEEFTPDAIFDIPGTVVIGEVFDVRGCANTGTTVDIFINDVLYASLNDLVIDEDGEFEAEVIANSSIGMGTPGTVKLKVWVNCPKNPGDAPPAEPAHGETEIVLVERTADFAPGFNDYGLDTNSNSLYDYLVIEKEIIVKEARNYSLYGWIEAPSGERIDSDSNYTYLDVGLHSLKLRFDGLRIYNAGESGNFGVDMYLYDEDSGGGLGSTTNTTSYYSYTDFERPPAEFAPGFNDYGLDADGNLLYDYLVIEKQIIVREAGNYRLRGWLYTPSGKYIEYDSNSTYLDVGLHSVKLQFYGPSIYNAEESGNFDVNMELYDRDNGRWLDSTTNPTSYYNYSDFERPSAEFTGNFDDYGLDIGEDGLYNYLVVESGINVTKAGEYRLSGNLRYYDEESDYWLDYAMNRTHLEAGINNITLKFHGWRIYNSEYNGSFKAELQLYDTEARIDEAEYNTSHYNYTEFNPSPPVEIPVTEIYVFDGSNGAQLWNISIRNCLAAAYPISDIDGDNVSELLINKWIMEDYEAAFSKIEIAKGTDATELWNKSFANCFAVAYPVTDLNGDSVTELVVDAWRFDRPERPEPITEIFVVDGHEGSFLWNRSVTEGYLAAAYPVTDFTGDNITEIAINAFNLENPSTIVEIADGVDGTSLWSKTINNSLSAIYPATDLTKDDTSELIINSWLFSKGILSESEVFIVNGSGGTILWNFSANGMAATYPATDLTNNNVSEIIIDVWGPELESTKIFIFEGLIHTKLFSKTKSNSLAAAYPVSDLTGDNVSEVAINELKLEEEAANVTIISIKPSHLLDR